MNDLITGKFNIDVDLLCDSGKASTYLYGSVKEVEKEYNYGIIRSKIRRYIMPQIIPIKDLKNTSEISEMCHRTEEPIYVTKNGYGDMVIMSMENYEATMRQIAMYRDIEISEKQIESGQVKDARAALRETRAKYGL